MRRVKIRTAVLAVLAVGGLTFGLTACNGDTNKAPAARSVENNTRNSNYDKLVARQPSHSLTYSPTRATKNFWIDTWGKDPNKLSYVYIQNAKGDYGYFIFKGLPVSYCTSLTPPQQLIKGDAGQDDGDFVVSGPSIDGTYSSGSNCNAYYGIDAVTGAYVEFSVGQNQSYFLYDQPLSLPAFKDAQPLGPSTVAAAKKLPQ